jgi:uncharacterized protein YdhG (YjbR/CyaY superfamily)
MSESAVESYLAGLTSDQRQVLEHVRAVIRAVAPQATETISYQMPAFRYKGRRLVYYAAFRDHFSLFPASYAVMEKLSRELAPFRSGRGTLRFTVDQPLPDALVVRIIELRLAELDARG